MNNFNLSIKISSPYFKAGMSKHPKVGSSSNPTTWLIVFFSLASLFYLGYWLWLVFSAFSQSWEILTFSQEVQVIIGFIIITFWLTFALIHFTQK